MSDKPKRNHRIEEVLSYQQGFMEVAEAAAFEAHLAACEECQRTHERTAGLLRDTRQALSQPVQESRVDLAAIRAETARARRSRAWVRRWLLIGLGLAVAAGVAFAALSLGLVHLGHRPEDERAAPAP